MQLTYRGAQYDYTPRNTEAVREATVFRALRPTFNLHYRGSVYAVDPNVESNLPVLKPTAQLLYRGAAYALNGWAKPVTAATSKPAFTGKAFNHTEFVLVHRNNLYSNLQHRLQVARDKGDQDLINLLERELQQIA